ncbi:hypothetical protein RJ492_004570 [Pluralibacter gergoviae]|uniref:Uncharacterized protein n=1 Tax=Pluralibacter gergoviae TaxID=61647 RepID=A0AAI9DSB1_PLUGE|nr:hypothetical protein [Pluralibacter gergoviae]AVR02627.1 hypothetical protein A8H26_07930 [Pluralibacter gergoviae]EKV0918654.1 hypothetical protein [Pluralibacter gergoviae]EKV9909507.1 hypothetical protein [Pluralibacter gergoviae]EKW7277402.1 hypothetical protein [Pluralibacter gergoviae]ELD4297867.1 hypothetical protein [Pluralibacter gergoviae]
MNLKTDYQNLLDAIFNGDKDIAIFVMDGVHYYVIDNKCNYCIDVRPEYKAYIAKGWMKESLYDEAVSSFRNGFPILSKDNFKDYITKNDITIYTVDWMRFFFTFGRDDEKLVIFYDYVERFLSTLTDPVSIEWDSWRMRLPKFYINFDKKIYRHTDWDRSHDATVPSDWSIQANSNFGLLVPDKEQYWLINGMNFWKLQM